MSEVVYFVRDVIDPNGAVCAVPHLYRDKEPSDGTSASAGIDRCTLGERFTLPDEPLTQTQVGRELAQTL